MTDWPQIITQIGFPIAVAGYLLFRMENKMEELSKSMTALAEAVALLKNEIAHLKGSGS